MKLKDFFDNPEELIISGLMATVPIYWIIGWWVTPVFVACGLLWRAGGVTGGNKLFRRIGVPLVVCGATFLVFREWWIFLAGPFMVWLCPASYGKSSWLFKWILARVGGDGRKADIITRGLLFFWYWSAFFIALIFCR